MGMIGKEEDVGSVKTEKKSKKNKNKTNDLRDVGDDIGHVEVDGGPPKEKVHKHKKKKRKSESDNNEDEARHKKRNLEEDNGELGKKDKKKRKSKKKKSESNANGNEAQHEKHNLEEDNVESRKKDKKKRKRDSSENNNPLKDNEQAQDHDCDQKSRKEKKRKHKHQGAEKKLEEVNVKKNVLGADKKKKNKNAKKKKKIVCQNVGIEVNEITTEESGEKDRKRKKKKAKSDENNLEKPKAKGKSKKVSFSSHVEVFPSSENQNINKDGLVRGKRFTPEEDALVKEAVLNYIESQDLGDEGLKMVLNCKSYPGLKKCWREIGNCIPYRPHTAVYYRAHILFERAEQRSWTPEEIKFLQEFHEKHGNDWKMAAEELGKHRFHVKDAWRRIKFKNQKGGRWTQEEYQNLYDLVNLDLQMKVTCEEKKSKHGMLRDNIPWTAISEKLTSRSDANCCIKWYNQLTSSLVAEKKWSDADDYRLIGALYELDAACVEDVDWDNLLEHRSGEICRKRWNQMVMHIGHHGSKPFAEQVDTLAKRYSPDLAETREAWDNKPVVP